MLSTTPSPQPQPTTADYGLAALNLYTLYTRASYALAAGAQAPDYDPTQPTKDWIATVDPQGNPITPTTPSVVFGYYLQVGNTMPVWVNFILTGLQALTPNIPGIETFQPYVIAPTPATQGGDIQAANQIQPNQLSTMAQALALAESWGMTPAQAVACIADTYNEQLSPYFIQYNGETRLWLTINWNGTFINVGEQIQIMYAAGVGAPGSWATSGAAYAANDSEPVWVSTQPTQAPAVNAAGPVPQRQLNTLGATNETFSVTLMAVEILNGNVMPPAPAQSTGGMSALQAAQLSACVAGINTLLAVFSKPPVS